MRLAGRQSPSSENRFLFFTGTAQGQQGRSQRCGTTVTTVSRMFSPPQRELVSIAHLHPPTPSLATLLLPVPGSDPSRDLTEGDHAPAARLMERTVPVAHPWFGLGVQRPSFLRLRAWYSIVGWAALSLPVVHPWTPGLLLPVGYMGVYVLLLDPIFDSFFPLFSFG